MSLTGNGNSQSLDKYTRSSYLTDMILTKIVQYKVLPLGTQSLVDCGKSKTWPILGSFRKPLITYHKDMENKCCILRRVYSQNTLYVHVA